VSNPAPPAAARAKGGADAALATLVVAIVATMIIPIPLPLLDTLLALNISLSIVLLLVALFVAEPLAIASFPTILLVTTLYRLALDVAATRNILGRGDGGELIRAFGRFVVGGNYVVGAVVFAILTLVQFLVIAKGSERVAEVGARFTLDAMPGKQMTIDAELRAGGIDQAEARRRRRTLARESSFYGAMDGAMKFVKGDAIAGIVITLVNILGGLAIGVGQRGMAAGDALKTYGLMTIGEGLVAQIPALVVSTAAGILVTRVASEEPDQSLGGEIARQIVGQPRALMIAAGLLAAFGLTPGMPAVPFLSIAALLAIAARAVLQAERKRARATEIIGAGPSQQGAARTSGTSERDRELLRPVLTPVEIEVGTAHAALVESQGTDEAPLRAIVPTVRDAMFRELGVAIPGVRVRVSPSLPERAVVIRIFELPSSELEFAPNARFVAAHPRALAERGIAFEEGVHPSRSTPGGWIAPEAAEALERDGIESFSAAEVVGAALRTALRKTAPQFVGIQETQALLDGLEQTHPALVRNLVPKPMSVPLLAEVLRRLVEEQVSIRPLREILEGLAPFAAQEKDPIVLADLARQALRRHLSYAVAPKRRAEVWFLSPDVAEAIRESITRTSAGAFLRLPPELAREIAESAKHQLDPASVIVCDPDIRRFVWVLLDGAVPDLRVLSHGELEAGVVLEPLGTIGP
jgi:type III secretion protein V